jgi:hypothetical protein
MSNHTSELYTIFCVLESDPGNEFSIKVDLSATIYDVKKVIVKEDQALNSINPKEVQLYQVDITGTKKERGEAIKKRIPELEKEESLDALYTVSQVYPVPPTVGATHFLVRLPARGDKRVSKSQ